MSWLQTRNPGFVNLDLTYQMRTVLVGSVYRIEVQFGTTNAHLVGDYSTEAAALQAARELCVGVDPTTITGGSP